MHVICSHENNTTITRKETRWVDKTGFQQTRNTTYVYSLITFSDLNQHFIWISAKFNLTLSIYTWPNEALCHRSFASQIEFRGGLGFRSLRFLGGGLRFRRGLRFRGIRFLGGLRFRGLRFLARGSSFSRVFGLRFNTSAERNGFSADPPVQYSEHFGQLWLRERSCEWPRDLFPF